METLKLAQQLINIRSITPNDNGCQELIIQRLAKLGFHIQNLDSNGVKNIWAYRGESGPMLVFSGHTDVVPPGPETKWTTPPFQATVRNGNLYGRGAADMKGALAAMVIATENFVKTHPDHPGRIGFIITSDEEGDAQFGTKKVVQELMQAGTKIDYCIIGEATSSEKVGDSIKIGRRGSLHGHLQVIGKQGHIAYPHLADNPIHRSFSALDALTHIEWDQGNEHFSPTSLQIYNINADTGASNIIPGALTARFNFRFAPVSSADSLKKRVHEIFDEHDLRYKIEWNLSSKPFLSTPGKLLSAVKTVIVEQCQIEPNVNTGGGTSDGRFLADMGCEIVELGVLNKYIHKVNEHVKVSDLETLTHLYENILQKVFTP